MPLSAKPAASIIPSRREAWIVQLEELLTREKELTRLRDLIAQERRALPSSIPVRPTVAASK
jgi:predicted dithiol-disulfide oxidoreductase (DUF899 family)